ncbi:ABC transporter ATP-binding protein [Tenacibaculum aquimarinum]|uniref:ABC transporter ATP-binding protein n=1 Tax=Tenacibaculum aquimarinum TaxID=2910675 RepID=UPI0035A89A2D
MKDDVILKVEKLSKQYRLGTVGTGTISHDLNRWWAKIRGKDDPYLKVGESNDRSSKGSSEYVWALKDINFEVKKGEVLGIIGKNGAGKSTLLKILSKVTGPTTGSIKSKGRIASLLEVGTGFHPEMTGRENIFLNGAILGMTKKEIASKLDEIIDFSGCERYVDTPVKRYSSGMKVRLAFAVAAHLEPDILVVDEVLAVGDAEFQKKAIGKMQDISKGDGRTVLFVSHDMGAVKRLCNKCVLLENGTIKTTGETDKIVNEYLSLKTTSKIQLNNFERIKDKELYFNSINIYNKELQSKEAYLYSEDIFIEMNIEAKEHINNSSIFVMVKQKNENRVFAAEKN